MFDAGIYDRLLDGAWITVQAFGLAVAWGTVVAVVLGVASLSHMRWLQPLVRVYVEVFRGVSAIVLLFWTAFALPPLLGVRMTALQAAVLALGLNMSAYGAEIVRGGVQAVPPGQSEAAIAVNLSNARRLWSVVLPQAVVTMLPTYGSLLIEVMKASALVSLIGLRDIMGEAQNLRVIGYAPTRDIFAATLILYFGISLILAGLVRLLERYFGRGLEIGRMAARAK
jgi:polar amino acid transport system permease protein